jgi:beta-glucanase (GH16 family)
MFFYGSTVNTMNFNIYLPDEVYVENGLLRLRSRIRKFGGMEFTSGRLDTKGKLAPVYGRFEIRANFPQAKDFGPRTGSIPRTGTGRWNISWLKP